jgi:hypothetical protein
LTAIVACLVALPAVAQTTPATEAPASAAAACELHVWPAGDLIHLYYGWAHGGTINGSAKGREGYPPVPVNPLTAETQGALLASLDLPTLLKLPGYKVVIHPTPLTSREIRASTSRLTDSESPCYAEFMIDDLLLTQNVIGGNALRASFRFREFGLDAAPQRQFGNFVMTKLLQFPPKDPSQEAAAGEELKAAFRSDVTQFTAAATKPPKHK